MVWNMLNWSHTKERRGGIGGYFVPFQQALHLSVSVSVSVSVYKNKCICISKQLSLSVSESVMCLAIASTELDLNLSQGRYSAQKKGKIYKNLWFRAGHIWAMITVFCCCYWNNFFCFWFKSFQLRFSEPWDLSTYFVRPQGLSPSCYSAQNSQSVFYPVYLLGNISIYIPIHLVKG